MFIKWGSTVLYDLHVKPPKNAEEATSHSIDYKKAGLNGAIGSMDGVHILMDRCEASMANEHTSHKMKQTARAFNVDDVLEMVPYALLRLQSPASVRAYDTSRMRSECYTRYPDQDENHSEVAVGINDRDILFVRNISQDLFRRKLVEHFDILFERRALQWLLFCERGKES